MKRLLGLRSRMCSSRQKKNENYLLNVSQQTLMLLHRMIGCNLVDFMHLGEYERIEDR